MISREDALLWARKWRMYRSNALVWNRLALHYEFAQRRAFLKWPVHGEVLSMLREGRLTIGEHAVLEPDVWLTGSPEGRIHIGAGSFLNIATMIAAQQRVEIGDHVMLANGCLVTDADHRFDDPELPVPYQGFTFKGPTRIGDNAWLGAGVVVTGGVSIGERAVIGANSVVTRDIPPRSIAAGVPAKVLREIAYPDAPAEA